MLCEFYFNKKQREKVRRWSIDDSTWLDHNTAATATAKSLQMSGMQPRDPFRPWRGTLASGHKPR